MFHFLKLLFRALEALKTRAMNSPMVAQSLAVLQATNTLPSTTNFELKEASRDCSLCFEGLADRSGELEKGAEFKTSELVGSNKALVTYILCVYV